LLEFGNISHYQTYFQVDQFFLLFFEIRILFSELEKQKENQKLMEKKLKTMQEKLLIGGVTILDRTTQQEKVSRIN